MRDRLLIEPGKLPAGAAEQMQRQVDELRTSDHCIGVELLAGPGCELAESLEGRTFGFDEIPELPIEGCTRIPCCGCCFIPVLSEDAKKMNAKIDWKQWIGYAAGLIALIVMYGLLSGCATYRPTSPAWIACDGSRCDELWSRAQVWVAKHSAYRIQIANDNIIQTYGPMSGDASPAYSITREREGAGAKIIIHAICYDSGLGCMYDPSPYANGLLAELKRP